MRNEPDPIVGEWYQRRDKGEMFRVVAADSRTGCIELQYFDGDLEELETDAWREMDMEPPEDWTGPFDDIETDDLDVTETAMSSQDWRLSLESLRTAEEPWQDTRPPDELEEEEEGRPIESYAEEQETLAERAS